jgi:membrane dipeptidase
MRLAIVLAVLAAKIAVADDFATRARALHAQAILVDTHLDAPDQLAGKWADLAKPGATDHLDIPRAQAGGVGAAFFSIYVAAGYADRGAARRALELIDVTHRAVDGNDGALAYATNVAEIRAAKAAKKIAILMGIEGGHAIEDSLAVLRAMYREGVRYMTLTHSNTNHWADSSGGTKAPTADPKKLRVHGGLSDFGREVVKEMNRLGMIVDISHVSDETIDDVLAVSRAPVMASHSSCRAIANIRRNLSDDHIMRIAKAGGIVMISFGSAFLDQKVVDWYASTGKKIRAEYAALEKKLAGDPSALVKETRALWAKAGAPPRAPLTAVADHIEHVIAIAGEDAVGLGTDFDGIVDPPVGLEDVSLLPKLTEELLRRGHSDARIKKILGENFLAFFARVEAVKAKLVNESAGTATMRPRPR